MIDTFWYWLHQFGVQCRGETTAISLLTLLCALELIVNSVIFFYFSSACWQCRRIMLESYVWEWTDLSSSQEGIAKGRLLRWKLSEQVPRKKNPAKISFSEIDNEKRPSPQAAITFGSLVPHVRVQGLQVALNIYSSWLRGLMGEIRRDCPAVMGFQIISPVQPFIRIEEHISSGL